MQTSVTIRADRIAGGFAGSFILHGAIAAALVGWAYFQHSGQNWGDASTAGAIQATMVNDIPLPQKQPTDQNNVLATDTPSPAPITATTKTVEIPKPDAIPIPIKPTKPVKTAEKAAPAAPLHPQPIKVDPNKAQTGEATGVRITMSSTQTRAGTVNVGIPDAGFGARFAYYREQITQKVAQQWYTGMLDPQAAGHRVYITFEIQRDGTPTNIRIAQASGDATLDRTALSAVQHIDTFGPLPDGYQGSFVNVTYYFDPPSHP
jgi:periplasmic protein TonB